jgi:hypothetical protein
MRLLIEDMIAELKIRLRETKGIRNKILLKDAIKALAEFRKANEKKI